MTTTQSPVLEQLPAEDVLIGDLEDLERLAGEKGCDLLVTHSHGRQAADAARIFHSIVSVLRCSTGLAPGIRRQSAIAARATLIFSISNLIIEGHENNHEPTPDTWRDGGHAANSVIAALGGEDRGA